MGAARTGLCPGCRHVRRITNRRGSTFLLCRRSETDPDYPRYPPLPVLRCRGFESGEPAGPAEADDGEEEI
ncbi:MAG TPA: hypothetical protein VGA70_08915 [Longimicrobiales bacterium]|jgi:hypothetical protein